MARNPEAVAAMNEAKWEIATHGLKWIDYRDAPPDLEAQHIAEAIRIHTEVAGARPLGFYQGRSSINTIRLGAEEGGFLYCADVYADDLPYWMRRAARAAAPHALHARFQRHALRHAAGLQFAATSSTAISRTRSTRSTPRATSRPRCCRSACTAASSGGRGARRRSPGSSTTCSPTTRPGFRPGSTSPATGSGSTRRPAAGSRRGSPGPCSSSGSAGSTSTRPGSRPRPTTRVCRRTPTRPKGSRARLPPRRQGEARRRSAP